MSTEKTFDQDHAALIAEEVVKAAKLIADDVYVVKKDDSKKANFLQYVITSILSVIAIVSVLTFATVKSVQGTQIEQAKELVRLKTVQDNNVQNIISLSDRVSIVEINQTEAIKAWVELNFARKK